MGRGNLTEAIAALERGAYVNWKNDVVTVTEIGADTVYYINWQSHCIYTGRKYMVCRSLVLYLWFFFVYLLNTAESHPDVVGWSDCAATCIP